MQSIAYDIIFKSKDGGLQAAIGAINANVDKMQGKVSKINDLWGKMAGKIKNISFSSTLDQIDRFASGLNSLNGPGLKLSTNMYDLQAITGVTGDRLKEIEGYARANAKTFGGSAADSVEAYKLILSQLSPEIAKQPAALKSMGNSVSTLSKTMGGDAVAATEVLTTAMNQYNVSTDDPIAASREMAQMMNVMAAGAKEGSAELPQIKSALEQSGMAAKAANVSFAETNAAIQVLDKAGKKGSEGGVALRNTLATLSEGRFLPKEVKAELAAVGINVEKLGDKSLPLTQRLALLKPIMQDSALVTKLFGKENQNAAMALISGIPEIDRLTTAITGTNTAYEQAAIVMESPAEKQKRIQASIDDLQISIFNGTNGWLAYAGVISDNVSKLSGLAPVFTLAGSAISLFTSKQKLMALWTNIVTVATGLWDGVMKVLNATFWANPITWIIALIIALIAVIAYVIYTTDGWGAAWQNVVTGAKFLWAWFTDYLRGVWAETVDTIMSGIELIKIGWYKLKGLWDEEGSKSALAEIDAASEKRKAELIAIVKSKDDNWNNAMNSFQSAAGSLHSNGKDPIKDIKAKLGLSPATENIADAKVPGGSKIANTAAGAKGGTKKTNEAIATGGTKNTTVHITIGKQIETMNIHTSGGKDAALKMRDMIVDEISRSIAMAGALAD